jgi:signal transduction histidine kinase
MRFRDLPIWSKLALMMLLPTLTTMVVAARGLVDHIDQTNNAGRARALAALSSDAGHLVHELQNERASATKLLKAAEDDKAAARTEYTAQASNSDKAAVDYRLRRQTLQDVPSSFRSVLGNIDTELAGLQTLRERVGSTSTEAVQLSTATTQYGLLIKNLLGIRDAAAQLTGDSDLNSLMRAAAAVSTIKEYLSQERIAVVQILGQGMLTPENKLEYLKTQAAQDQALAQFQRVATPEQNDMYNSTVTGLNVREVRQYEAQLGQLEANESLPSGIFTVAKWDAAMVGQSDLLLTVEQKLDARIDSQSTDLYNGVQRTVLIETALLMTMLVLAVLFAWVLARSMNRSLRELRHGALTVAQYGLPQAVARLRDPALVTQMSAAQVAEQIAEPLPVRSRDEFGQVTEAFNAVHLEAVRTAAEQAALRSSVSTMFVNLARRSQILVDRLIGHLDRLERGEEDPDRLAELFQLDHLATRMRRNDENLLVLAGADSTRIQREPASLMDVIRAAQSEVEHYTRVEFGVIDRDIEVAAHAVNDMVHLIAELCDNATAFSPPDSTVIVEARRVGDRAVLQVEDRGIGISAEQLAELNEKLATPPMVDVTVSRMMGLVVVARLAARHGVKVELRAATDRGTVADVLLPATVLVPRALGGRVHAAPHQPALGRESAIPSARPAVAPRSPFAPALALPAGTPNLNDGSANGNAFGGYNGGLAGTGGGYGRSGAPPAAASFGSGLAPGAVPPANQPTSGAGYGNGRSASGFGGAAMGGAAASGLSGHGGLSSPGPGGNGGPRSMPAWSDLTGVPGTVPPTRAESGESLPQRQPGPPAPDATDTQDAIPRQRGAGQWESEEPIEAEIVDTGDITGMRATASRLDAPHVPPPAAPVNPSPSAWPPVADSPSGGFRTVTPPGGLPRYSDMTSELPRIGATGPVADRAAPSTALQRLSDETMEMPIFKELESAWFRLSPAPEPLFSDADKVATEPVRGASSRPDAEASGRMRSQTPSSTGRASMTSSQSTDSGPRAEEYWRTPADEGWSAAAAAAHPQYGGETDMGLPKRVPMAQLVPGGVEKAGLNSERRTPEGVRGLLSAYHRGVQRGRSQPKNGEQDAQPSPAGQPGGKEQE